MIEHAKISVILPVYNVERYISRCIESLRAQTLADLEFIFVDDCSTDDSMAEVEAWGRQDARVRILRNVENSGSGISRNCGIEAARGDYLSFVDPDDYISPKFYELLYAAAAADGGHDIAKGLRVEVASHGAESRAHGERVNNAIATRPQSVPLYRRFSGDHWTAIYNRHLFEDGYVRYGKGRMSEDTTFTLRVCHYSDDIVLENRAEYFYRFQREGSVKNTDSFERFSQEIAALDEKMDLLIDKGIDSHAYAYIAGKLRYYMSCYRADARYGNHLHADYGRYWETIERAISRLPQWHHVLEADSYVGGLHKSARFTIPGLRFDGEGSVRVSVILPVCNPGLHIERRIESLQQQLLDGLEFIFVDDCGADGSMAIVAAWASQDDRVRILRNDEKLGPGASRNCGIEAAQGDYLSFIDPDDHVSPESYELLYLAATTEGRHDIAKGCHRNVDGVTNAIGLRETVLNDRIHEHRAKGLPLFRRFTYEHSTAIYNARLFKDGKRSCAEELGRQEIGRRG